MSLQRKLRGYARLLERANEPSKPQLELLPDAGNGIPISEPATDAPLTPPNNLSPAGDFDTN